MRLDKQIKKTKPVILTLNYNELYLANMVSLLDDYTVIVYECHGSKPLFDFPKTVNVKKTKEITPDVIPDVVVCQCVTYHYATCKELSETYGCPLIIVEHEAPEKNHSIYNHITYDKVIFYSNEHYGLWVPNNSSTAKRSIKNADIIKPTYLADSKTHGMLHTVNSNLLSSINEVLYAMGKYRCVVAPGLWENIKAITHNFSGFFYNPTDKASFPQVVKYVSGDYSLRKSIGQNAGSSVELNYSNDSFRKNWYRILDGAIK